MLDFKIFLIVLIVAELVTLFCRFVLGLNARKLHFKLMKKIKMRKFPRIHHSYITLILSLIFYYLPSHFWLALCLGLTLQDFLHHLVLKLKTGDSELELAYVLVDEFGTEKKKFVKEFKVELKDLGFTRH